MLTSGMLEAQDGVIYLRDKERAVVELVLAYLYTGKVEVDTGAAALRLACVADEWGLQGLAASCLDSLYTHYAHDAEAALAILPIAERLSHIDPPAKRLIRVCVEAVVRSSWPPPSIEQCMALGPVAISILLSRSVLPANLFVDEDAVARFVRKWMLAHGQLLTDETRAIISEAQCHPHRHFASTASGEMPTTELVRVFRCPRVRGIALNGETILIAGDGTTRVISMVDGAHIPSEYLGSRRIWDIAATSNGDVVTLDKERNQVQVIKPDGTTAKWGAQAYGHSLGKFDSPENLAVDREGRIYVTDWTWSQVQVFNKDGTFVQEWGGRGIEDGKFRYPHGVAVSDGRVFVADAGNNRIQVFATDGTFLAKWGSRGAGDGQFDEPEGVAVDAEGRIFVADTNNHRIQVFEPDGTFLGKWGREGREAGQFFRPGKLVAGPGGLIYVCCWAQDLIQVFGGGVGA
jgi:hypothetical protein